MKRNQIILIAGVLVIGAIGYATYKIIKKKKAEKDAQSNFVNASGQEIGTQPCSSSNSNACRNACERMGGTFNENGDRRCYKNGVAISGGLFGGYGARRTR